MSAEGAPHPPSWYAATANRSLSFPTLEGAINTDIVIIGAGYAGLSAALHLRKRGYGVVVLEANRVGWGASGRNGGQIHSGQRRDQWFLERHVGEQAARDLWDMGEEAKALIRSLIYEHDIECDLTDGLIHGDHKPGYLAETRDYVELLQKSYGYDKIRFLERDAIRDKVATDDFHGGFEDTGGGHLHPLNFALGLATAANKAGAQIFENSPARGYEGGDNLCVSTANGTIQAKALVLATNGYLGNLEKKVARHVMPLANFIVATEPLGTLGEEIIPGNEAVSDSRFVINYFRLSPDKRMLFGGGERFRPGFPDDIPAFVRPYMLKLFPQLSDTRIDYGWGGILGITPKRMPCFKRLAPNIFNISGFCGQGVTIAPLAGQVVAEAIDGTLSRFDLFAGIRNPAFPGGTALRRPIQALAIAWFALRDRF